MAIDPDPRAHVTSSVDFYALLSLPLDFPPEAFRGAYRKGSRLYHPDKTIKPGASDAEKLRAREQWDLFEIAAKVLENAEFRTQYDQARAAREHRHRRDAAHDAARQRMVDRLERREGGSGKRDREAMETDDSERQMRRLAADGKRMREEYVAKKRAQMEEAYAQMARTSRSNTPGQAQKSGSAFESSTQPSRSDSIRGNSNAESGRLDDDAEGRTIRIRFPESSSSTLTLSHLENVFRKFGALDSVVMGKTRKERFRPGDSRRQLVCRAYLQFDSIAAATRAVNAWSESQESHRQRESSSIRSRRQDEEDPGANLDVGWLREPSSTPRDHGSSSHRRHHDSSRRAGDSTPSFASFKSFRPSAPTSTDPASLQAFEEQVMARLKAAAAAQQQERQPETPEHGKEMDHEPTARASTSLATGAAAAAAGTAAATSDTRPAVPSFRSFAMVR